MLKKPFRKIEQENGTLNIYGNNQYRELYYSKPDWSEDEEECFDYKGNTRYLSEYMAVHNRVYNPNPPEWMKEFDGYNSDSYFSGTLVKLAPSGDAVKVFTYTS